jgi:UDP-N-acetylglucosamine--N-acetylmuramyl-(pentapeptide) pyrophosphoryl-undecaprenol N-acetylglucosamine transferase
LRVIIAGGGTGGHVYPGLAVVERLRSSHPDAAIMWLGNPGKLEARIVPTERIEFHAIRVKSLSRKLDPKSIARNIGALFRAVSAMREARDFISSFKPDFIIGTGGYVSGPPLAQAAKMGIPTFIIEPNSYPGLTVRWLAKRVDRIFLGSEKAANHLKGADCKVTGIPVIKAVINTKREEGIPAMGLLMGKPCMLVVGGSQGAIRINQAVLGFVKIAAVEQPDLLRDIQILHQTGGKGPNELEGLRWEYPEADYVKMEYIDRMAYALAATDLAVSRAGAATLSEIKARGIPSILVPYPPAA